MVSKKFVGILSSILVTYLNNFTILIKEIQLLYIKILIIIIVTQEIEYHLVSTFNKYICNKNSVQYYCKYLHIDFTDIAILVV